MERRFKEHQDGNSAFDRTYRPFRIILTEEYYGKDEAMRRERQIKSYKGGNSFIHLIGGAPR